jgi:hypothetical protein
MRKIAIGLIVGASSLAAPASAATAPGQEKVPTTVHATRMQGGATLAMSKSEQKIRPREDKTRAAEGKIRPAEKKGELKFRPGEGKVHGDPHVDQKGSERMAPKKTPR